VRDGVVHRFLLILLVLALNACASGGGVVARIPVPTPYPSFPTGAALAFIPNRTGYISVVTVPGNVLLRTIALCCDPDAVATSPKSPYALVSQFYSGTVTEIDTRTGSEVAAIAGCYLGAATFNPTGAVAYITQGCSPFLLAVSIPSLNQIGMIPTPLSAGGQVDVAINPAKPYLYVTCGSQGNQVVVESTSNYSTVATVALPGVVNLFGVVVSPDGNRVYVGAGQNNSGGVFIIDASSNEIISQINLNGIADALAVSPDGSRVYVTLINNNSVAVISTASNSLITTIPVGKEPSGIAIDPTGSLAYVLDGGDGTVTIVSTATNSVLTTLNVGGTPWGYGSFIRPPIISSTARLSKP
jgi:YVTN family beta-propeller protein